MTITNKLNLPEAILRAIQHNWYAGSGENRFASVTELIKPTKQFLLTKRHYEEIIQDASDMIWTLMGSAIHRVIEAADIKDSMSEERLRCNLDGNIITGGVDLYKDGIITDFKFTSVWNYTNGGRKEDWEKQLNLYAYILNKNGYEVHTLHVVAIFRDWQKRKSTSDPEYPNQIETIELELWNDDKIESFLESRINDIKSYEELPDDLILECTPEERWQSQEQYAVYHKEKSRALRVFDIESEAEEFIKGHKDSANLIIKLRNEVPKRCFDFCSVNQFCHYYRQLADNKVSQAS